MESLSLEDLRQEYGGEALNEANCETNPFDQFAKWMIEAQNIETKEPTAMTLSTATPDGRPSARVVLLKEVTENGFVFYTNYRSRKGREIAENPHVALTFYWPELERQVRVEGRIAPISQEKSEAYFRKRPRGSRLGAIVSNQSEVLPSRAVLEAKLSELQEKFADTDDIPRPESWGGYSVTPQVIEFWQGRRNRLHDRLVYETGGPSGWTIKRLSP